MANGATPGSLSALLQNPTTFSLTVAKKANKGEDGHLVSALRRDPYIGHRPAHDGRSRRSHPALQKTKDQEHAHVSRSTQSAYSRAGVFENSLDDREEEEPVEQRRHHV
jgi:hypothetical protein